MMQKIFLNIGDIVIGIESQIAPEEETANRSRFHHFIPKKKPSKIDINIELKVIPKYKKYKCKELFRTERDLGRQAGARDPSNQEEKYLGKGLDWRTGRVEDKILFEGGTSGRYQLLINEDLIRGEAFIIKSDNNWKLTEVVYGFLQVLIIYYLAKKRCGALFHAAGLNDGEKGFLFTGLSGAGKSTTSRIWDGISGIKVLNDDRIIVRKIKGELYMYPTPWHGDYSDYLNEGTIKKVKLSKLFYIYHRDTNLAERVHYTQGFNHFFKTLFLSFWDKDCVKFTFDFLADILAQKPCYKFGFKNDARIVSYIRGLK